MKTAAYIVVLILLAFSYPYIKAYYDDSTPSPQEQSDPNILLPTKARLVEHEPRIISARLLEERPNELKISVEYTIPSTAADDEYNLSVHPDMGHWRYSNAEVQKGGRHISEVTVGFRPQREGLREVESTKLMFYFGHYKDRKFIKTVGNREAPFPKTWRLVPQ